jgi:hypothetical protein
VVKASGVDPTKPPTDETVAALAAAISWRRGWRPGIKLALSDTNRLSPGEGADPGDLVFTRRRGRVVWLPRLFDAGRGGHALSCFHRNLTQLSLQVESLSQFVVYAHGLLREWQDLPVRLEECLANALRVLGDLSSGRRTTYRSHSPMRQMKDNDVLEVIEEVRGHFA